MKILYIHQYFTTPEIGGATRSYHLAHALQNEGHEVHLIFSNLKIQEKEINGIQLHNLSIPYQQKMGFVKRALTFLRFAIKAYKIGKSLDIDKIYATSTPLTVGYVGLLLHKKKNIPFLFEVRDLWPKVPESMGILKNKLLLKFAYRLERKIFTNAEKIIVLSSPMKEYYSKITHNKEIEVIPNFCTINKNQKSFNKTFSIVYAGSLGYANDIEFLKFFIRTIKQHFQDEIVLRILGEGQYENEISSLCASNCQFVGQKSKEETLRILHQSDANLISFANDPWLWTGSPNKFFDGLGAGCISLINFGGWIKEEIEYHQIGYYLKKDTLVADLKSIINSNRTITQAKTLELANDYSKEIMGKRILSIFEK